VDLEILAAEVVRSRRTVEDAILQVRACPPAALPDPTTLQRLLERSLSYEPPQSAKATELDWLGAGVALVLPMLVLEASRVIGDLRVEALTTSAMADMSLSGGAPRAALEPYAAAADLFRRIGDTRPLIQIFTNKGMAHRELSEFQESITCYEAAIDAAVTCGDQAAKAETLSCLAVTLMDLGDYARAQRALEETLSIARACRNTKVEMLALGNLGNLHRALGDFRTATTCTEQALQTSIALGDTYLQGRWLATLADIRYGVADYDRAERHYREALAIARQLRDARGISRCLGSLATNDAQRGRYQAAFEAFEAALGVARSVDIKEHEARWLAGLSSVAHALGQFDRGLNYGEQALALNRQLGVLHGEALLLNNLASMYAHLGDYARASQHLLAALDLLRMTGDRSGEINVLLNLGNHESRQGRHDAATQYFERALSIAESLGDTRVIAGALASLGATTGQQGQYERSEDYLRRALALNRELGDLAGQCTVLFSLGVNRCDRDVYDAAGPFFEEALALARATGNRDHERDICGALGIVADKRGRQQEAYDLYTRAIQIGDDLRHTLVDDAQVVGFGERLARTYSQIISLCCATNRDDEALEYVERAKSRATVRLLAHTALASSAPAAVALIEREHDLLARWRMMQNPTGRRAMDGATAESGRLRQELDQIYAALEPLDPEYVSLRRGQPLRVDRMRSVLVDDSAAAQDASHRVLIEYFVTVEALHIFVISSRCETTTVCTIPVSARDLSRHVHDYWQCTANRQPGQVLDAARETLSRLLLEPMADVLSGADLVYISPHGPLHYVPFQALTVNGAYLASLYPVCYTPSAAVLGYCRARPRRSRTTCLAIGVDFDNEAIKVAAHFKTRAQLGAAVTRDSLRTGMELADVIHFSCHGYFNADDPLASGMSIGQGQILSARDVFSMRVNADLVTLSACDTGLNRVRSGDELLGLTRAFLHAGAASVIVGLWPLHSDATEELVDRFYRNLTAGGMSKAAALRSAQLELHEHPRFHDPHDWAGLVLVGDWR
jgi:CHAT domain-containing protein/Tfp pilus assembly protein PilF